MRPKTHRVRLVGANATPAEIVQAWKELFLLTPPPNSRFYPSLASVAPRELLFIRASVGSMPVYTGVRVIYADDESFKVMTPEGHLESGWNTFSAWQDEVGTTVAQILSLARQRLDLRDRISHRRFHGAGEDLDPRPQVAGRALQGERAYEPGECLHRPEVAVVGGEERLAQRRRPLHAIHDGRPHALGSRNEAPPDFLAWPA
jgi:hypothetical protein